MKQATAEKMLFREQPFMISREARKLDPNWDCEERVLVHIMVYIMGLKQYL
jgi:hypothetical protein